jgi:hypothetical protein
MGHYVRIVVANFARDHQVAVTHDCHMSSMKIHEADFLKACGLRSTRTMPPETMPSRTPAKLPSKAAREDGGLMKMALHNRFRDRTLSIDLSDFSE